MQVRAGASYCDVVWTPTGLAFCYVHGSVVSCEIDGRLVWFQQPPETRLLFLRCGCTSDGRVYAIGQGHDTGAAWLSVDGGPFQSLGLTFGVQPVGCNRDIVYIVRSSTTIDVLWLPDGARSHTISMPPTSQGIRDVTPESHVRLSDDWMQRTVGGLTLSQPSERGDVTVGQCDPPQIAGAGIVNPFTAILGLAYEPHIVETPTGYAVCARTPGGAALVTLPPYQALVTGQPIPPEPEPEPEEPIIMPTVPDLEIARAQAALAKVRADTGFGPNMPPLPYIRAVAQTLGWKWGLNGKRGNPDDPSGDVLAFAFGGAQPQLYDVLRDGGGDNKPAWQVLEYPQPFGAVWLSPGAVVPQPGPGPTPQPPQPDLSALIARVAALEARLAALDARQELSIFDGSRLALVASDGHVLCAEGGGGGEVNATREQIGTWETFRISKVTS